MNNSFLKFEVTGPGYIIEETQCGKYRFRNYNPKIYLSENHLFQNQALVPTTNYAAKIMEILQNCPPLPIEVIHLICNYLIEVTHIVPLSALTANKTKKQRSEEVII